MRFSIQTSARENRVRAAASVASEKGAPQRLSVDQTTDNSPGAVRAAQLRSMVDTSARVVAQRQQFDRFGGGVAQRAAPEDELQMKARDPLQAAGMEDEELLQGKFSAPTTSAHAESAAGASNDTGLPDQLKAGVERLSGLPMDDVQVHRNSSQPADLQALAYTQGSDIHVAPGQDRHLAHEAWHVVQQKEGRVRPEVQMKGVDVNADPVLEHEADVMGAKAASVDKDAGR
jgi:hypothetical protein